MTLRDVFSVHVTIYRRNFNKDQTCFYCFRVLTEFSTFAQYELLHNNIDRDETHTHFKNMFEWKYMYVSHSRQNIYLLPVSFNENLVIRVLLATFSTTFIWYRHLAAFIIFTKEIVHVYAYRHFRTRKFLCHHSICLSNWRLTAIITRRCLRGCEPCQFPVVVLGSTLRALRTRRNTAIEFSINNVMIKSGEKSETIAHMYDT